MLAVVAVRFSSLAFVGAAALLSLLPSVAAQQFERIDGGAGTGCGRGADYSFFFRPGTANKVVVDFEGGEPRPSDPRAPVLQG